MSNFIEDQYILLFQSVSYALKAEKILKKDQIPFKLIPVPKNISSECGICLRFNGDLKDRLLHSLNDRVDYNDICKI